MLTKLKLALLIAAPLVAGATTYAIAGNGPGHDRLIEKFDKNGDGKLDEAERAQMKAAFEAQRAERHREMLARFDTNHDGTLDAAERAAMRDARATERFRAMDKNGDGQLSLDEFKAGAAQAGGHRHGRHGRWRSHGHGHGPGQGRVQGQQPTEGMKL